MQEKEDIQSLILQELKSVREEVKALKDKGDETSDKLNDYIQKQEVKDSVSKMDLSTEVKDENGMKEYERILKEYKDSVKYGEEMEFIKNKKLSTYKMGIIIENMINGTEGEDLEFLLDKEERYNGNG